jgi:hypothetical protein
MGLRATEEDEKHSPFTWFIRNELQMFFGRARSQD